MFAKLESSQQYTLSQGGNSLERLLEVRRGLSYRNAPQAAEIPTTSLDISVRGFSGLSFQNSSYQGIIISSPEGDHSLLVGYVPETRRRTLGWGLTGPILADEEVTYPNGHRLFIAPVHVTDDHQIELLPPFAMVHIQRNYQQKEGYPITADKVGLYTGEHAFAGSAKGEFRESISGLLPLVEDLLGDYSNQSVELIPEGIETKPATGETGISDFPTSVRRRVDNGTADRKLLS